MLQRRTHYPIATFSRKWPWNRKCSVISDCACGRVEAIVWRSRQGKILCSGRWWRSCWLYDDYLRVEWVAMWSCVVDSVGIHQAIASARVCLKRPAIGYSPVCRQGESSRFMKSWEWMVNTTRCMNGWSLDLSLVDDQLSVWGKLTSVRVFFCLPPL